MSAVSEAVSAALTTPIRLDIGCGKNKKAGFIGIDLYDFDGVDIVADVRSKTWYATKLPEDMKPRMRDYGSDNVWSFADNSIDEAHASHFLEHLTNFGDKWERVHFFNELYRILKVGAQATIIIPAWSSNRYYGDPTHKEPFSEMGPYYLNRAWRMAGNAPHADASVNPNGYSCDFDIPVTTYNLHGALLNRHAEYQQHAVTFWKEAATDITFVITKRAPP